MNGLLNAADYLRFPQQAGDFRYAYGARPLQFAELSLPATAPPHPVIALIHGGCYREIFDLRPLSTLVRELVGMGYAVWNIEYRRHGCDGGFPNMFLDAAAAVDFLRQIAREHEIDLGRVISLGHSAGGHLALWLAGRRRIPAGNLLYRTDPVPIPAALALAPLCDIASAWQRGACGEALLEVMGGSPADAPANYRAGSPAQLLPLGARQLLLVGEHDNDILSEAQEYTQAAVAHGDPARLLVLPGAGHFEIVDVRSAAWRVVRGALQQFAAGGAMR
ncbi:MAG: alpha/beta hydrolase [Chloroflexi bacterium]|nr:alpha/beta hydrolase [Chloroflexota bacterium]